MRDGLDDLRHFRLGFPWSHHARENSAGLVSQPLLGQPPRAFGNGEDQQKKQGGGEGFDGKHPAPFERIRHRRASNEAVAEKRGEDAQHNGQLLQGYQAAPNFRRRNFRDVKRRYQRGDADAQSAHHASPDQFR